MTMSDVAAQMLSILVSAFGLVIFRLIAKYLPEDPPPVPRKLPAGTPEPGEECTERPS
ncbi:hypothetical protein [Streptomyces sp. NBC_01579]|uniref:hypothetical protein n=1 Tax=Streptomyces sp. NBC_01579 TaxID=2975885 RepID=UPI00386AA45F